MAIQLSLHPGDARRAIKRTSSLCPHCLRQIDAEVYERDGRVYLAKRCPEHGAFDVLINSDRRFYYESVGAGGGCCGGGSCGPASAQSAGHDPDLVERATTCIALVEIVESCNLQCPTCYADSPYHADHVKAITLKEFRGRLESVLARKGRIDILQLSGGEPTIHPRFVELLEGVLRDSRVGYVLLNTNGVRLAGDAAFTAAVGALHRRYRKFEVYLQYDGPQESGQAALRGADLRRVRRRAVEAAAAWGVPTTLAMTVTPDNLPHLGDAVRDGLSLPGVRGMSFQPMFGSGRTHVEMRVNGAATTPRLNVADVVVALVDQSAGLLTERDFTPLPCGDPNCHTIGYLLRKDGQIVPVSRFIDFSQVQDFLKDRVNFTMADLERCGCETEPLGETLRQLEIGPDHVFRLFIKPFMDAWTYDQHRIDRCCVHVIGEGGRLESFCRHYAMRAGHGASV